MENIFPRVEINLEKIRHNAKILTVLAAKKGISVTGVTKGVAGNLDIANVMIDAGITCLADSKMKNIIRMKKYGLHAKFMLLRTPALSEIKEVVEFVDISMNSELSVIRSLAAEAIKQHKVHSIILMVEMGDLREGIMVRDLPAIIREVIGLKGVHLEGLGTNFACFGGIIPTEQKMIQFSQLAREMQRKFSIIFSYISGGNSANYNWLVNTKKTGLISNLRFGESILLGRETVNGENVPGLYQDAFCLVSEVIEVKSKPSRPFGETGSNAFGERLLFKDNGMMNRAIIGLGRQDVMVKGLEPLQPVDIIGSSSDHIILNAKNMKISPGDLIKFSLNYGALLSVMTSPYIYKKSIYRKSSHAISKNLA